MFQSEILLTLLQQYDYVELSREVKGLDDIDDGLSQISGQHNNAYANNGYSNNGHYSGEPKSYDSSRPLASLGP
jgi:hypothetical protein